MKLAGDAIQKGFAVQGPDDLPAMTIGRPAVDQLAIGGKMDQHVEAHLRIAVAMRFLSDDVEGSVRCPGQARWFDAWAGRYKPPRILRADAEHTVLPLRIRRRESIVLCLERDEPAIILSDGPEPDTPPAATPITGPWVILDPQGNQVGDQPGDWCELPGLADFAGTLRYQTTFEIDKEREHSYELDLGQVGDWAVVHVNGRNLGVRFWAPFVWDVTETLQAGKNELTVEVTNSLANKYDPKKRRPSGLLGRPAIVLRHRQNRPRF